MAAACLVAILMWLWPSSCFHLVCSVRDPKMCLPFLLFYLAKWHAFVRVRFCCIAGLMYFYSIFNKLLVVQHSFCSSCFDKTPGKQFFPPCPSVQALTFKVIMKVVFSLVRSRLDTIEVIDSGKLIQKVNIPLTGLLTFPLLGLAFTKTFGWFCSVIPWDLPLSFIC